MLARPSLKTWSCLQGLGWRAPARCLGPLWKGICGPNPLSRCICAWWLRVPSQGYHHSPSKVRAHSTDVLVMYLAWFLQNNSSRHSKFQKLTAKKKKRKKQSPSQLSPARHLLQLDSTQDRDACTKVASRTATRSRWAEGVAMFDADIGQMEEIRLTTCYLRNPMKNGIFSISTGWPDFWTINSMGQMFLLFWGSLPLKMFIWLEGHHISKKSPGSSNLFGRNLPNQNAIFTHQNPRSSKCVWNEYFPQSLAAQVPENKGWQRKTTLFCWVLVTFGGRFVGVACWEGWEASRNECKESMD